MELSDMQFLVAEDHSFQRHNLVRVLKDLGAAEVKEAADGKAAYSILTESSGRLDVVICDLDMPGMNGMELMWRMSRSGVPASAILVSRLGHAL
ncbi:MAG: response regulator, partial [Proteobacteria bacterium]|nr:response regulator [Pseudomonadota bacterium]